MSTIFFTPYSFSKIVYMRDKGATEVGGFCVSLQENPGLVVDFHLVSQLCDSAYCEFTDDGMVEFNDEMAEAGYHPQEYSRMWLHTHPGTSANPSGLDEETFTKQFGGMDWSAMLIVARGGQTYGRIRYAVCNAVDSIIGSKDRDTTVDLAIDWSTEYTSTEHGQWDDEYDSMVTARAPTKFKTTGTWAQREYQSYINRPPDKLIDDLVQHGQQKIIGYKSPYDSQEVTVFESFPDHAETPLEDKEPEDKKKGRRGKSKGKRRRSRNVRGGKTGKSRS